MKVIKVINMDTGLMIIIQTPWFKKPSAFAKGTEIKESQLTELAYIILISFCIYDCLLIYNSQWVKWANITQKLGKQTDIRIQKIFNRKSAIGETNQGRDRGTTPNPNTPMHHQSGRTSQGLLFSEATCCSRSRRKSMKYPQKFYLGPNSKDPSWGAKTSRIMILTMSMRLGLGNRPKNKQKWNGMTVKKG